METWFQMVISKKKKKIKQKRFPVDSDNSIKKSIYWFPEYSALHAPEIKISIPQRVVLPFLGGGKRKSWRITINSSQPYFKSWWLSGFWWPLVWQEMDAVKKTSLQRLSCSGRTVGRLSSARVYCLRRSPKRGGTNGIIVFCQRSLLH